MRTPSLLRPCLGIRLQRVFLCIAPVIVATAWAAPPLPATVAPLQDLLVYPLRSAPASVISENDSRLSSEISAVIERIPRETGEVVEPGTPLVELSQTDLKLQIRAARASLDSLRAKQKLAKEQYQRVRKLAKKHTVTEELVSQRRTEAKVSAADVLKQEIRLKELNRDLKKTVVRAPFTAVVVERLAHVGELAMSGTPLVRVVDTARVEVSAQVQSYDVPSLERAAEPRLVTERGSYPVRVHRVVPLIDERERSQEVRLRFSGVGALIGSSGRLAWQETAPFVPADLLVRRGDHIGVFVVEDGLARFIPFEGAEEGRPARNPLPLDSAMMLDGRFVVEDGQAVRLKQQPLAERGEVGGRAVATPDAVTPSP